MKRLVMATLFVLLAVGTANAQNKGYGDGAVDAREGGESWGDALVIPDLPYTDTGATCDNSWTVDLSCGYTAGTSPDVFYSYTACMDGTISASLCGSSYDTQLAVFNSSQVEIACNDDFCGLQSQLSAVVTAGEQYYIMVSGFFGGCGSYTLEVTGPMCATPIDESTWSRIKSQYR